MAGMILFLHSSGSSPRQWSGLAQRLATRHRVEAPPLVGHDGHAGWRGARPTLRGEVEHLLATIRFDEPVDVVGHSYGGAVAIKAALSGLLDVRSLAVYEPSLFAFLGDRAKAYDRSESPIEMGHSVCESLAAGRVDEAARTYVDYWSGRGTHASLTQDRRARLAERMDVVGACFHSLFGDEARARDLHRLSMPCLVMSGNASPRPSQDICEMVAGHLADGRHHRFDNLGHMGPVAHPARVFPVIEEFLGAVARAQCPSPRAYMPDHMGWARARVA
jgi:pimeloyl-ACP methyl ester carboxylesterase